MKKQIDIEEIKGQYESFLASKKTMVLAMNDEEGNPFSSTAPFVQWEGKFYIYISKIAEHFSNLMNATVADVLFVADEAMTPNHFATERARWQCKPTLLGKEGTPELNAKFDEVHSAKMMNVLRTLDFEFFELQPLKGRYVVGFGKAFDLNYAEDSFTHVVIDKK